jgi:glycopeptide antibiotics resistance protein
MTAFKEIIMNVIIFVPYGVYISMLKENWNILKRTAPIFLTSLAYESLQYILSIGASDITDLIGNTLGGISGVVLFWLLSKVLKDNTIKVINILALIGTVFMAGLLGMLVIANL